MSNFISPISFDKHIKFNHNPVTYVYFLVYLKQKPQDEFDGNEEYVYNDEGRMTNSSFLDYRMPTSYDVPMIEAVIVEVPNPGHPYGVRGVGEVPIVPPAAAIANAIYGAIGIRMKELPMSPDRILAAMGKI